MGPVGLGGGQREWDDYEWFPSGGGAPEPIVRSPSALVERVDREDIWESGDVPRILLVDLDNMRAGPLRWIRTKVNDLALHYRNRESLRRLADLARRRTHPAHGATVDAE